jgi:hypothetical protein
MLHALWLWGHPMLFSVCAWLPLCSMGILDTVDSSVATGSFVANSDGVQAMW